jgi:hypothetical protein
MIAYQTDRDGVFVGVVKLDRDPLEQNKWLIPAGAFIDAPPLVADRQFALHDGSSWVVEDLPPEPSPPVPVSAEYELDTWRANAVLSKAEFLIRVKDAGILTKGDAKAAARGEWPASMQSALSRMTDKEAEDAEITWAAASTVERKNPMIYFVQAAVGLSDEQVDNLFKKHT